MERGLKMAGVPLRGKARLGCSAVLALLVICMVSWLVFWGIDTHRVPNEIALGELVQAQTSAMGTRWSLEPGGHLTSDSDMTYGLWVYWAFFRPDAAWLQFHAFRNPSLAKRFFPPFPALSGLEKDGTPPNGWDYIPPNADDFFIDCTPEAVPRTCRIYIRYQEYSIIYETYVAGMMTLADLQHVLEVTDRFMANHLNSTRLEWGKRPTPTLLELGLQQDSR